jgi:hypothetical protein
MKITKIIYTAAVVNNPEQLNMFVDPTMPNKYCHHCTLQYGDIDELPSYLGKEVCFVGKRIYANAKAVAMFGELAGCEDVVITNKYHHITISTADGVKPVYSNQLIEEGTCKMLDASPVIKCTIGAFVVYEDGSTDWVF